VRILVAHNYYGSSAPSGENQVFELERDLLQQHGHEALSFVRHSDEIRGWGWQAILRGAAATPWAKP
jgi:hypothetical protein